LKDRKLYSLIYQRLHECYGPQGWWPVIPPEGGAPRYDGGPVDSRGRLEVMVGAILAQNTSWVQASKALGNLFREGLLDFVPLTRVDPVHLSELIRSSGYYNQKARRIKSLVLFLYQRYGDGWESFFKEPDRKMRSMLLGLNGIGPETADSIMLYAAGRCSFVVDNYTRRLWYRMGLAPEHISYEELKQRFEEALSPENRLYVEYHALVVKHCVERCTSRAPECSGCVLLDLCLRQGLA
jgi:endonuclease III related protein